MMGSLAPHGIIVVVMTVMRRSFSFSMVLVAITAGTPQPDAISMGMNDLPDSPKRRNTRSMMKATRARYPHPSKNDSSRNSTMSCGTKPSTAPTPPNTPSTMRLVTQGAAAAASSQPVTTTGSPT